MANQRTTQPSLESVINRYDRQELIEGWDQRKLTNASVVVAGEGVLSQYVVMALAALGFGKMEVYVKGIDDSRRGTDYHKGFIRDGDLANAARMAEFAERINPLVQCMGVSIDLSRKNNLSVLGKPDVIIDASNDSASKKELMDYCIDKKCLFVSLSSSDNIAKLGVFAPLRGTVARGMTLEKTVLMNNLLFHDMDGKDQDPFTGMMVAAIAADEARKYVMPMANEKLIEDIVVHNMHSDKRFDIKMDRQISGNVDLSGKRVLMIGAGALGNFVGLGLTMTNLGEIILVDKDTVESTNLNRQPFFYDSVGREKVPALISKMKRINPDKSYKGIVDFLDLGFDELFKKNAPDLIIDCVDNDKTRALLNYYSTKYKIPMISSATRYNSGHVNVSVPGKTSCLDCQREIDKYALEGERVRASQSCIYAPQASVITSNMAVAGMVVCEAISLLAPQVYKEPITHELKYISSDDFRVGSLPVNKNYCECFKDSKKISEWPEKMGGLYKKAK